MFKLGKLAPIVLDTHPRYSVTLDEASQVPMEYMATHEQTWPMWDNDQIGDCTIAAACNAIKILYGVQLTDTDAVETYSAFTGYSPANPATDQGAACSVVLEDWKTIGIPDSKISKSPITHISEFHYIDPKDLNHVKHCIYMRQCCYVGVQLPEYVQSSPFYWATPQSYMNPGAMWGGHCILLVGYDENHLYGITWGRIVTIDNLFWLTYAEEAWAIQKT